MDISIKEIRNSVDENWALTQKEYRSSSLDEQGWESLFTLSNGYIGVKGSIELATLHRDPKSFFAGVFDKPDIGAKKKVFGLDIYNKALTPALAESPVFRNIEIYNQGRSIDLVNCRITSFSRTLDIQRGLLISEYLLEGQEQRFTNVATLFFVSREDYHYCAQFVEIKPINYSADLVVKFINSQSTKPDCLLRIRDYVSPTNVIQAKNHDKIASLTCEVSETKTQIQVATKTSGPGESFIQLFDNGTEEGFALRVKQGETYRFTKQVCFVTSLDNSQGNSAIALLRERLKTPISTHFKAHVDFWHNAWTDNDVVIEGDKEIQLGTRWCVSNLIQLGNRRSPSISISATGLHGNGYFGHIFWDTELWIAPFFVATDPNIAQNLLLYRYNRLDSARQNAKELGFEGAKFPWTSAQTGLDVTPPDWAKVSKREIHISGAVAYSFWNYLQWTGDREFFNKYGLEVIVETAKFWASIFTKGQDGLYHLEDVVGPDEYNIHASDNYYTNYLAKWNMLKAVQCVDTIKKQDADMFERIMEATGWDKKLRSKLSLVGGKVAFPRIRNGVCEQHRGFFDLPDAPGMKMGQCSKREPSAEYSYDGTSQTSKQADVVMMHYLFAGEFNDDIQRASYNYYRVRCIHGSSLSSSIYCIMGQRLGETEHSYDYFRLTALQDIKNLHLDKNLSEGIHVGCAGGTWKAAIYGFGGVSILQSRLHINPVLPEAVKSIQFSIKYHARNLRIKAAHNSVSILLKGEPLEINLYGKRILLDQAQEYVQKSCRGYSCGSKPFQVKAVIFDLDGVIVDTAKYHYLAWKKIADEENICFNEEINERLKGVSRAESINIILEKASRDYSSLEREALAEKKNSIYVKLLGQLKPTDFIHNARELVGLLRLKAIKTAVYSVSKNADMVIAKLGARNLFDVIVTGNDITRSKPDPQGFLIAAERLKLSPEECLVIEDASAGIEAANKANMKSIGIGDGGVLSNADIVLLSTQYLSWENIEKLFSKGRRMV